jgi:hypothetical protein
VRLQLSVAALERVDATAERLGLSRGKVVDALVRALDDDMVDYALKQVVDGDAKQLTAWRERCIPS